MVYREGPTPAGCCPRDREQLVAFEGFDGVKACETCGGIFADAAASQRIVKSMDRLLLEIGFQASFGMPRQPDDGRAVSCPECLIAMQRVRIESAACFIDACPTHGTWFDVGELEDVMRAFARNRRRGGLPAPGNHPPAGGPAGGGPYDATSARIAQESWSQLSDAVFRSLLGD